MSSETTAVRRSTIIRYGKHGTNAWLWAQAPCRWQKNTRIEYITVPLDRLEPAGSLIQPKVTARWLAVMKNRRCVPPPVVCATETGTFFLFDGNHRYRAMQQLFGENPTAEIKVALVSPKPGFRFRYRWFSTHGTYVLEPSFSATRPLRPRISLSPLGRTLVLVAHPDDETGGCAALLQRLHDPVVVYATDGAPDDYYFWQRFGTRESYGRVRRQEALMALATAGVHRVEFLANPGRRLRDQQLYLSAMQLFEAACDMIQQYKPDALLVPAYEGGHPDHDTCSFIGWLVGRRLGLPVWEMPLYHRSEAGALVAQHFRSLHGNEVALGLSACELQTRAAMMACYRSQPDLADYISCAVEYYRPQPDYDYSRPPHSGLLNYQAWQWPMTPDNVCSQFSRCMLQLGTATHACRIEPFLPTPPNTGFGVQSV